MTIAVIDLDLYKYHASAAGEKRDVVISHKTTGYSVVVKNRTEFYGHWKRKNGGILAELNRTRTSPYSPEEFVYEDRQHPEPIENVLHTAKIMVQKDLVSCAANSHIAYLGEGESWRVERSTVLKYKQNRDNILKPIYLAEVTEYLRKKFNATVVSGWEADEAIVMECYKSVDKFALIEDKDFWGCPINVWDRNQQHRGVVNCNKFGSLFIDNKGKVRGEGRIWLYHQVCSSDQSDNYAANSASDIEWGEKSSFNTLVNCKSDDEAFLAMTEIYKKLYPTTKEVIGWRGEPLQVDWKYMLEENFQMARMYRHENDHVSILDVLKQKGLI